jgi:hypothetical protein
VVVASPELIELARIWSKVGLVARSFWVAADAAVSADAQSGIPMIDAVTLGPGGLDQKVKLAQALAEDFDLGGMRIMWLRSPGDTSDISAALLKTHKSLLRLIPQRADFSPSFAEVVVPSTLDKLTVPPAPADWQQFVVEPTDRPTPTGLDTYYDTETAPVQGLHAALLIGGILGGAQLNLEHLRDARLDTPWVVHPFSRIVRGGDRVRQATETFLRERFPGISAAHIAPEQYLEPDPADLRELLGEASEWIRGLDDGALRFDVPSIKLDAPKRLGFIGFALDVLRFIPWAFRGMFGLQRWVDLANEIRERIARRLEADDYGATIGREITAAKLHLTDWDAVEAEHRVQDAPLIEEARRGEGAEPRAVVWNSLSMLALSLIDGSATPPGWGIRGRSKRVYAYAPSQVLRFVREPSDIPNTPAGLENVPGAPDELRRLKRLSPEEAAAAAALVQDTLRSTSLVTEGPTGRVTRTAQQVVEKAREAEDEYRETLSAELGERPDVDPEDLPLLMRLRARVVADLLLARATAERFASIVETKVDASLPRLRDALRLGTWWTIIAIAAAGLVIGLVIAYAGDIDQTLQQWGIERPANWVELLVYLLTVPVIVLLSTIVRLYFMYRAYNEVGRRRVEYGDKRVKAAIDSYDARNRLRNGERVLGVWEDILSHLHARDLPEPPKIVDVPSGLPDAMQVADLDISDVDLQRSIDKKAAEIGWWRDALTHLLETVLSKEQIGVLGEDDGVEGGFLADLRREAIDGSGQREYWLDWATRRSEVVVRELATNERRVRVSSRADRRMTMQDFLSEITKELPVEYKPGADFVDEFTSVDPSASRAMVDGVAGADEFALNQALSRLVTVLTIRRFGRGAATNEATTDDAIDDAPGRA